MDAFVAELEKNLAALLAAPASDTLRAAARHLCLAEGAKRARPRLTYAFGQALGVPRERLLEVALAAELIHSASLLHDDVVDAGSLRRGRPTANAAFGNHAAVLSGDLLICFALRALRAHPPETTHLGVDVVAAMTRAALSEVEARGNPALALADWRAIAAGKTGVLFAFCGAAPALYAGDLEAAQRLSEVGERLGVAFQMADDLADLEPASNKDPLADLRQRNPSALLALGTARSADFAEALAEAWGQEGPVPEDDVSRLASLLVDTGAAEALQGLLREETEGALVALAPYQGRPGASDIEAWTRALTRTWVTR